MTPMPNATAASAVLLDVKGPLATLTLNRPDKLNALNAPLIDRLQEFLDFVEAERSIRAVIFTGAGERAFSAGADIHELRETLRAGADTAMRDFVRRGQALTRRIENFPKPVIAAVNGLAYGGGCEVVEACPLAIAADEATFAKPEIRLGFAPPFGGTQRLPRLVGRKRALRMILTGDVIDAAEAKAIGLVNEVAPRAELYAAAQRLAERVVAHTPDAVRACLASVTRGLNLSIDEGLAVEAMQFERMATTTDVHAGVQRFVERTRQPADAGRGSLFEKFLQPVAGRG
jgi:enoyl-CoA hydratase/carnithine racemase